MFICTFELLREESRVSGDKELELLVQITGGQVHIPGANTYIKSRETRDRDGSVSTHYACWGQLFMLRVHFPTDTAAFRCTNTKYRAGRVPNGAAEWLLHILCGLYYGWRFGLGVLGVQNFCVIAVLCKQTSLIVSKLLALALAKVYQHCVCSPLSAIQRLVLKWQNVGAFEKAS